MVDIELAQGEHTVRWTHADYAPLNAVIDVTETGVICKTVNGAGAGCYTAAPVTAPGVLITAAAPFTVTGYLAEAVTDFDSWVKSKGGAAGIKGNKAAVFEIKDGYAGIVDLGFTVTKSNVFTVKDYYAGIT